MRHRIVVAFISSFACGGQLAVAAGPNMKAGLWEITITVNMPAGAGLPHKIQQCFNNENIENLRGAPGPTRLDRQCQINDYKIRGNTTTWKMACQGEMNTTGTGAITYKSIAYSGKNTMTVDDGGHAQTITTNYAGKYIGDCK